MKLKLAAIIAVVVLFGAVAAYFLDFAGSPPADTHPSGGEEPLLASAKPKHPPEGPRTETSQFSKSGNREGEPARAAVPSPLAAAARPSGDPPSSPRATSVAPTLSGPSVSAVGPPTASPPPVPVEPDTVAKAAVELDQIGLMLRDFRTRMGENPTGTNSEIMKAVMGGNPKQAKLGPPEGHQLNGDGELIDRWGTPYFFHQLSKTSMEIRSAGPDKQMWTDDDVIQH